VTHESDAAQARQDVGERLGLVFEVMRRGLRRGAPVAISPFSVWLQYT